jgi:hypothetical protein
MIERLAKIKDVHSVFIVKKDARQRGFSGPNLMEECQYNGYKALVVIGAYAWD